MFCSQVEEYSIVINPQGWQPRVSVVIPTIGQQPLLPNLIADLKVGTHSDIEIIVSHSGNQDPPALDDDVFVVHQESPLLASAARNRGARRARGKYLFFIDDDNDVESGTVDVLASLLDKIPELVEVGPSMFYASDRNRVYCLGASHRGTLGMTRLFVVPPTDGSREIVSDALPNAFMVRRRDFELIGGFDEVTFPMEFEESDLAFRLRQRQGGYLACTLDAKVWHHAPTSTRQKLAAKSVARSYYSARNRPIFVARHLGILRWIEYLAVGQFLAAASRFWGIFRGSNGTGHSRFVVCISYVSGMVFGIFLSIREITSRQSS